ncbi:hypothetical protein [Methylibium rhizosphaerae]|uniref:hypothetical protein n=1 Tax=Methylibium rhizosphaerae TaxID=2570323 RepID=UPI00112D3477|nr:hypothetical protein [Methylibium rhizosphaerae]
MKRPEIVALFGPTDVPAGGVAASINRLLVEKYQGLMRSYFAEVDYDQVDGCYAFQNETNDLSGVDDLDRRLSGRKAGMWCLQVNAPFLASDVYVSVYEDDKFEGGTSVVISMDAFVTEYLESEVIARTPYLLFVEELAKLIGSRWFVSGLYFDDWRPLRLEDCRSPAAVSQRLSSVALPYFCGWFDELLDEHEMIAQWGVVEASVKVSLDGFKFISKMAA